MRRSRRFSIILFAAGAFLLSTACTSSPEAKPRPGDVFIDAAPFQEISFYFPPNDSESEARNEVADALRAAGLDPNADIELDDGVGEEPLEVEVDVEAVERTGFMRFAVVDGIVRGLGDRRILLQLPAGSNIETEAQRVAADPIAQTFVIESSETAYQVTWPYHLALLAALIGVGIAPYPIARAYVSSLRTKELDPATKVHRLQRVTALTTVWLIAFVVGAFVSGAAVAPIVLARGLIDSETIGDLLLTPLYIGLVFAAAGSISRAIQPYYRELRGIKASRRELRLRAIRAGLVMTLVPVIWIILVNVFEGAPLGAILRILLLVGLFAVSPFVIRLALGSSDMDPALRKKLIDFARQQGIDVRDIRALKGRPEKHGNALQAGVLPRLKYIFLTDYLIDELREDELLAVVAHEIAHAKKHHLLIKVLVPFLLVIPLGIVFALVSNLEIEWLSRIMAVGFPLIVLLGLLVLNGTVGQRLERSADDYACDVVGLDATTRALEKLAEINMTPRRTGRLFNLLTHHPSIADRVERLKKRADSLRPGPGRQPQSV